MTKLRAVILGGVPYTVRSNQTPLHTVTELVASGYTVDYFCRRSHQRSLRKLTRLKPWRRSCWTWQRQEVNESLDVWWGPEVLDVVPLAFNPLLLALVDRQIRKITARTTFRTGRKPDILVAYWWFLPKVIKRCGADFKVFDVIDRHWDLTANGGSEKRSSRQHLKALQTAKLSDATIVVSEALRLEFARDDIKAVTVQNGVDLRRAEAAFSSARRRKVAAYAGGLNTRLDTALLNEITESNTDWLFLIAGSGALASEIAERPNVVLLGDLAYDDVLRILNHSRVGLIPFIESSYLSSSNLLKVLDYMSSGLQVLATPSVDLGSIGDPNDPGIRAIAGNGWGAFFTEHDSLETRPFRYDLTRHSASYRVERILALQSSADERRV